jgi:hypothetical protein
MLRVATGRLAGKTRKQIAADTGLGLADSTVTHQLADHRTVTLIQRLKQRDGAQLERMWKKGLDGLEKDLTPKNRAVAAMARGQLLRILPLGDPPPVAVATADNSAVTITLEELLATYHQATVGAGDARDVQSVYRSLCNG